MPRPLNRQCCVGAVVFAVEEIDSGGREENTFDVHCSSKFITTSVVLDIRDQSLLMAWWGVEIIFGGNHWNFKGGSVTTESPKEAGITIPVPVIIMFCRQS